MDAEQAGMAQLVAMNGVATTLAVEAGRNAYADIHPGIYVGRIADNSFKVRIGYQSPTLIRITLWSNRAK